MRTLKFISKDQQQKKFARAVRERVMDYFTENNISTKGNLFLAIQTIAMLSLYMVPLVLIVTVSMQVWVALLMTILMGIGMAGVGMAVMHDAVHESYSNKKWVNKMFGATMYLLGSNVLNWKIQHNVLHHSYTNIQGYDQDIDSKGPLRLCDHAPLRSIHRYQYIHAFFFYGLMTLSKLTKDFSQLIEYNRSGLTRQHANPIVEYTRMVLVKIVYLFVFIGLPIMLTAFSWWQVLSGFLIMHWVAGCIMSTTFQMAHVVEGTAQPVRNTQGFIENDWAVHELQTTSDFARNNVLLNWYIGGLNFQIEHHLFPNVCHIHYRKIAPIVEKTAIEYGLNYNLKPSLLSALSSHLKRLKELGRSTVAG